MSHILVTRPMNLIDEVDWWIGRIFDEIFNDVDNTVAVIDLEVDEERIGILNKCPILLLLLFITITICCCSLYYSSTK